MLKNLLYFAMFTTFVVAVWLGLSIYHNFTASTITKGVNVQINPLDPTFNTAVLDDLKQRTVVPINLTSPIAVPNVSSTSSATIQLQTTITPTPTATPELSSPPVGTQSGQIGNQL